MTGAEYLRNPGLDVINAEAGWIAGGTGQGVVVALVDSGVDPAQLDLVGKISPLSTGVAGPYSQPIFDNHGTYSAVIIAGAFNDRFTVGVAYDATILSVRVDNNSGVVFDSNLVLGLDYATANGADVINLSLGTATESTLAAQLALKRATDAGIAVVVSAGNDGAPHPDWPGRYAVDPRFNGSLIAVGALNEAGTAIATFSNRAGDAAAGYVVAPGERITTNCSDVPGGIACFRVSGTSFSAPHVAGALAQLLDAFPNLTGSQAVDIVLTSARDMGAPGTDPIYGRGALDVQRAFQPIGTLSLPTAEGLVVLGDEQTASSLASPAFGDALHGVGELSTVIYDRYDRMFSLGLGEFFRESPRSLVQFEAPALQADSAGFRFVDGGRLSFSGRRAPTADGPVRGVSGLYAFNARPSAELSYERGAVQFRAWSGRNGLAYSEGAPLDPLSALGLGGGGYSFGVRKGALSLVARQGFGRQAPAPVLDFGPAPHKVDGSAFGSLIANWSGEGWRTSIGGGVLREGAGPLGGSARVDSPLAMDAETRFATFSADIRILEGLSFSGQVSQAHTQAQGPLIEVNDAISRAWQVTAHLDCGALGLPCTGVSLSLAQPLRLESAVISAQLAERPEDYFGPIILSHRQALIAPSGRELDLGMGIWRQSPVGAFRLDATAVFNEGHRKRPDVEFSASAGLSRRF